MNTLNPLNSLSGAPRSALQPLASATAGSAAAVWFNSPTSEDSRVLRAPAQALGATAQELSASFLASLVEPGG